MSREETLQDLLNYFGYGKAESKDLSLEIIRNLDNYVRVQETVFKRLGKTT
jgi:hypothetical protein